MDISTNGKNFIKSREGCKLSAYLCSAGVWTIGYGHTKGVQKGDTITQLMADIYFDQDIAQFVSDVKSLLKVNVTQNQFDALVSFAYNVGSDIDADTIPEGLGDSTLLKFVNAGEFRKAADEFLKWDKAKGKPVRGLTLRRAAERALFLGGGS